MKIKIFSALLLTIALFGAANAQTFDKAKTDQFFDRLAEKNKAMGSMTVAKDGVVVYTRAIGHSHVKGTEKKLSTPATKYRIGSISKTFTSTMIFQLIEEGKLKLTDTLDKFFPQIPNAPKITIAQMLSHRSGIHSFTNDPEFGTWRTKPKTRDELLAVIAASKPDFEPGEKYNYSNAAYVVLGFIVEKAGGKPYGEALKKRITAKVGLKDTYLGTGFTETGKNEAFSYSFKDSWNKESEETHSSIPGGAGAIVSTSADLTKFIQALFDFKLVSEESLDQMMQNKYGMTTFPLEGKTFYGHGGSIDGFRSILVYLPEEKLAVSYISNGTVYPPNGIVMGFFDIYGGRPFTIPTFESVAVSAEVLDKYVGVYSSPGFPMKITVTRNGAELNAQATGQSAFPLEATAQDKFKFEPSGIVIEFDASKSQMILKQRGQETVFAKEK